MLKHRWFGLGLIGLMLIFSLVVYGMLPERVPIHWNIRGEVDGYGSRALSVLVSPALGVLIWALFMLMPKLDPLTITSPERFSYDPFIDTLRRFQNFLLLFVLGLHATLNGIALGWPLPLPQILMMGIGLLFAAMGNEFPRLRRNAFAGIRVPWTFASEEVWRLTHRAAGRGFVAVGLALVIGALFLPPEPAFIVMIALVVGWMIVTTVYSLIVARRVAGNTQA